MQSVKRLHQRDSFLFRRHWKLILSWMFIFVCLFAKSSLHYLTQLSKIKWRSKQTHNETKQIVNCETVLFVAIKWETFSKYGTNWLSQIQPIRCNNKVKIHTRSSTEQLLITDFLFAYFIIFFFVDSFLLII